MIRWAGMEILEHLAEVVQPKHTGLLLWNFSTKPITSCFNSTELLANTKKLVMRARESGVQILHARQGLMSWEEMGAPMLRMRMKQLRISKPESRKPTPGQTLKADSVIEELEPEAGEIVFEKFLPNAFLGTCFEWWLRKYSLKTIVLAGASLETGIDGTAREALNRGYYTVIARDCVGSQFQDTYTAALSSLERIFDIVDSSDIIREWQNTGPRC